MKPVNVYLLTRIQNSQIQQKLERQMSRRKTFLKVKEWEVEGLRSFVEHLCVRMRDISQLCFYYSFVMPKLGKEYDLLRISGDRIINVELKSGNVPEEAIRKQLLQNRYYLAMLGKEIHSFTYISGEQKLLKLTNSDRLQEADWEDLIRNLEAQEDCYEGDIEDLFKEEQYLISPVSNPEQFLRREYFLTSQQYDIKRKIRRALEENPCCYQGFTGLPGTGKSILLFDIAMELSRKKKVCLLHMGSWSVNLGFLDERLKRVDFFYWGEEGAACFTEHYDAVLIDEGHLLNCRQLALIRGYAEKEKIPVITAYDKEDVLAPEERMDEGIRELEQIPGYQYYQLTNRIRVNAELSSFACHLMKPERYTPQQGFPSVQVGYANTDFEAEELLRYFQKKGYCYLTGEASGQEADRVVMVLDESFRYDAKGYLRGDQKDGRISAVRTLYHGINRAKREIALITVRNEQVFSFIMNILQKTIE